jgi:pantetheine-phosphate adenylyltransferase
VITALVPGSFDPPTNGHLDVIERCDAIFDRVVVGVIVNPSKTPFFSADERMDLLRTCAPPDIEIGSFTGLLVDYAKRVDADVIVKGLRAMSDFEYEFQMSQMNRQLSGMATLFLATKPEFGYLSSSLVKEVARLGGPVAGLVPEPVAEALKERLT